MTFKKDGSDPVTARPNLLSMGGLSWVVNAAVRALGFETILNPRTPGDEFRYRPSGRGKHKQRRVLHRNMSHVSRRVRRKHRKAAA